MLRCRLFCILDYLISNVILKEYDRRDFQAVFNLYHDKYIDKSLTILVVMSNLQKFFIYNKV